MGDRKSAFLLLCACLAVEAWLIFSGGYLELLTSGPHSTEQIRAMVLDWRTAASLVVVTLIAWSIARWIQSGPPR